MQALEQAKNILGEDRATFVLVGAAGEVYRSEKKGIAPVMELLAKEPDLLRGAAVADRVIGKAAAFLMIFGGVSAVYGAVMSRHAALTLEEAEIPFSYGKEVPYIVNRKKDGMCPMEAAVLEEKDPENAYEILRKKTEEGR